MIISREAAQKYIDWKIQRNNMLTRGYNRDDDDRLWNDYKKLSLKMPSQENDLLETVAKFGPSEKLKKWWQFWK